MKYFIDKLDRAGLTLRQGFVTECLGRRGAVLFFVLVDGMFMNSFVFCLWASLGLLIFGAPGDLPMSGNDMICAILVLFVIGFVGLFYEIFKMSKKEIAK